MRVLLVCCLGAQIKWEFRSQFAVVGEQRVELGLGSLGPSLPLGNPDRATTDVDFLWRQGVAAILGDERPMRPPFVVPVAEPFDAGAGVGVRYWIRTCVYASARCLAKRFALNDGPLSVTRNGRFPSGP